jgi:hypothetical protein
MALDAQKRPCFASDRRNRLSHNCTPACVVGQAVSPVNPVTLSQARDPGNRAATESRKPRFRPPLERSGDPQISPTRPNMKWMRELDDALLAQTPTDLPIADTSLNITRCCALDHSLAANLSSRMRSRTRVFVPPYFPESVRVSDLSQAVRLADGLVWLFAF